MFTQKAKYFGLKMGLGNQPGTIWQKGCPGDRKRVDQRLTTNNISYFIPELPDLT